MLGSDPVTGSQAFLAVLICCLWKLGCNLCLFKHIVPIRLRFSWSTFLVTLEYVYVYIYICIYTYICISIGIILWNLNHISTADVRPSQVFPDTLPHKYLFLHYGTAMVGMGVSWSRKPKCSWLHGEASGWIGTGKLHDLLQHSEDATYNFCCIAQGINCVLC